MKTPTDTVIRIVLLLLAIAAVVVMAATAESESLGRAGRFLRLALLGTVATGAWAAAELANPASERSPLIPRRGRPPRPSGPAASRPEAVIPDNVPATYGLRVGPSAGALAGGLAMALIGGTLGYALARTAHSAGGLILYILFGGGVVLALRSVLRLATTRRAVFLDADRVSFGPALGHLPRQTIARASAALFEVTYEPNPKLAIVDTAGRRFEIRPDHLIEPGIAGHLAALWPEVEWRQLPTFEKKV